MRTGAATAGALNRACSLRSSGCSSTRISSCASTGTLNHRLSSQPSTLSFQRPALSHPPRSPISCLISNWHRVCRSFCGRSIPDDQLLTLAEQRKLSVPAVLEQQVKRMLADPRASDALVDDFAAQWLNLRRVAEVVVDPERYPNYDLTLMDAFKRETELFVGSTIREDRSVLELLNADYTFVNEKLARHYGIPGVYGSRFRRVTLADTNQRGGLLAQGALLSTTSYPDRTSPVLRGKFLLNNVFGLQTTPPPAGVDTNLAPPKPGAAPPTIRERLSAHRSNPSCASCHAVIDPLGFALENFDVIGGWRTTDEAGKPVDAAGTTVSGAHIEGLSGLRALLLERREQFPRTVTEKLLAYALGRRVEYYDRPAVRRIVRDAEAQDFRWSALILGIVKSPAFQMQANACILNLKLFRGARFCGAWEPRSRSRFSMRWRRRWLRRHSAQESPRTGSSLFTCRTAWRWILDAQGRGRRIRALAGDAAARAVPRPDDRVVGHQRELGGDSRWRLRRIPHGHATRRQNRDRDLRRHVDGSAACATPCARHADRVAGNGDGSAGQRRRLHGQFELRLHAYAVVAQPDPAAADGVESARGVREAVRRHRHDRPCGARSAAAATQEPARLGQRKAGEPAEPSWGRRIARRSSNTRKRCETSSAASSARSSRPISSCRKWISRREHRRFSKITWR